MLPWVPGAAPRGGVPAQTTRATSYYTTLGGYRKSMSILEVVLASFWGGLGPPWGGLLALGVAFGRPKLVPKPSSKRLFVEKVIFHGIMRCSMIFDVFWIRYNALKVPKITPRRVFERLGSFFWPLDLSLRFLILFGWVLVPF